MWFFPVNGWAHGLAFIQIDQCMVAFAKSVSASAVHVCLGIAGKFKKHHEWSRRAAAYNRERACAFDRAGVRESQPRNISKDGLSFNHYFFSQV